MERFVLIPTEVRESIFISYAISRVADFKRYDWLKPIISMSVIALAALLIRNELFSYRT